MEVTLTSRGDLDDQRWLDQRIEAIGDGIEAVLDIARNWTDLRNLSRLHPGVSAQDYVLAHVEHPLGRGVVIPLLAESNWSNRQIAAVAGVDEITVRRTATNVAVDRPAETLGADGKLRPARVVREVVAEVIESEEAEPESPIDLVVFGDTVKTLTRLRLTSPVSWAWAVLPSYVSHTRAELKRIHQWMGEVIHELDKR